MTDECKFSADWTSWHFPRWREWLGHLVGTPATGCEIGSFEGRSAVFFLQEILTHQYSRLICIDPWEYSEEQEICGGEGTDTRVPEQFDLQQIKRHFIHNTKRWHDRRTINAASSRDVLPNLTNRSLDFGYIDGSHLACRALEDGVLIWPKMKPGGIVIWDDYEWTANRPPPAGWQVEPMRPKLGIDAWLAAYHGQYDRLDIRGGQVMVRKR